MYIDDGAIDIGVDLDGDGVSLKNHLAGHCGDVFNGAIDNGVGLERKSPKNHLFWR